MFTLWITAEYASRLFCFLIVRPLVGRRGNMANRFFQTKQFQHRCFNWIFHCPKILCARSTLTKTVGSRGWIGRWKKEKGTELARSYWERNDSFNSLNELKRNHFLSGRRFAMGIILKCTSKFTQALQLLYVYGFNANLRTLYLLA